MQGTINLDEMTDDEVRGFRGDQYQERENAEAAVQRCNQNIQVANARLQNGAPKKTEQPEEPTTEATTEPESSDTGEPETTTTTTTVDPAQTTLETSGPF